MRKVLIRINPVEIQSGGDQFFKKRQNERLVSIESEKDAVEKILPPECRLSPALPDLYALAASDAPFDNDPDNLVYIRPAVTG